MSYVQLKRAVKILFTAIIHQRREARINVSQLPPLSRLALMFDLNYSDSDEEAEEEEEENQQQHPTAATPAAIAAPTVTPALPSQGPEEPSADGASSTDPPTWWQPGSAAHLAEVLFIHQQVHGEMQHWVFQTEELRQRFPSITQRQWFGALDFLSCAWRSPSSTLRAHHSLLKRKRVKVSIPAGEPEQQRRTRRKASHGSGVRAPLEPGEAS